jgi:hypothetical protein
MKFPQISLVAWVLGLHLGASGQMHEDRETIAVFVRLR